MTAQAAAAADRAEALQRLWCAELVGEARPTLLVKLSAEMRACEKVVVDLVARVNPDVGPATLAELMARLGHSTPQAAMRYQHAAQGRDKVIDEAMSKLASENAHENRNEFVRGSNIGNAENIEFIELVRDLP